VHRDSVSASVLACTIVLRACPALPPDGATLTTLAIALHNLAAAREFTGALRSALRLYRAGVTIGTAAGAAGAAVTGTCGIDEAALLNALGEEEREGGGNASWPEVEAALSGGDGRVITFSRLPPPLALALVACYGEVRWSGTG
jgi:hypothetical protein